MKRVLNFRGVFYPFLLFLFGITQARSLYAGQLSAILTVAISLAILSAILIFFKKFKILIVLVCMFFVGNGFFFIGQATSTVKEYSGSQVVCGRVSDNFTENKYSYYVILDDALIGGESVKNISVQVKKNQTDSLKVGDMLTFEGEIESVSLFTLGQFNSNYYRNNVGYSTSVKIEDVVVSDGYTKVDESVRLAIKNRIYSNMGEENASIAYATLFGDKSGIDSDTKSAYRDSGIIHILTVSGLHVGFLITILYAGLKKCRVNEYVAFALTFVFIAFYAFLCGFTPSVVRAGVMGIVMMLSKLFRRRYDSLNSLGIAGFLICLIRPLSALDVGFLMSVACVCGIVLLYPFFSRLLMKIFPKWGSATLSISLSVQLTIFPFIAMMGSSLNFLSPILNLLIIPIFSIAFPYLFVVSILSSFMPFMGVLLVPVGYFFTATTFLARLFAQTSLKVSLSRVRIYQITLIYILCLILSQFLMVNPIKKFLMFSSVIFLLSCSVFLSLNKSVNETSFTYLSSYGDECVIFSNKKGQKLLLSNCYVLDKYCNNFYVDKIDYYLTFDQLKQKDVDDLEKYRVSKYYSTSADASIDGVCEAIPDEEEFVGGYSFTFASLDNKILGISICFDDVKIFVANKSNLVYNSYSQNMIEELSPDFVILSDKSCQLGEGLNSVAKSTNDFTTYSYDELGNFSVSFDKNGFSLRGLD